MLRLTVWTALAVILAGTLYEALVALGVIHLGGEPGEGPVGAGAVLAAALLAMLVGAIAVVWPSAAVTRAQLVALLAPAAGAFLVARFNTYDDYYLPTLRRASDQGLLSPELVYGLAALAVGAGLLTRVRPRAGLLLSAPVMLACAFFTWIAHAGH
jgi:hypothetical protein